MMFDYRGLYARKRCHAYIAMDKTMKTNNQYVKKLK